MNSTLWISVCNKNAVFPEEIKAVYKGSCNVWNLNILPRKEKTDLLIRNLFPPLSIPLLSSLCLENWQKQGLCWGCCRVDIHHQCFLSSNLWKKLKIIYYILSFPPSFPVEELYFPFFFFNKAYDDLQEASLTKRWHLILFDMTSEIINWLWKSTQEYNSSSGE